MKNKENDYNLMEVVNVFMTTFASFTSLKKSSEYFCKFHKENKGKTLIDLGKIKTEYGNLTKIYLEEDSKYDEAKKQMEEIIAYDEDINNNMRISNESSLVRHVALFESYLKQLALAIQHVENERIAPFEKNKQASINLDRILNYINILADINLKNRPFWSFYGVLRKLRHTIAHGEHVVDVNTEDIKKLERYLEEKIIVKKERKRLLDIGEPTFDNYISDDINLQYILNKVFTDELIAISGLITNKYKQVTSKTNSSAFAN